MQEVYVSKSEKATIGTCKLCLNENVTLLNSHIIPDFVFRWLRDLSVTKHFRSSEAPNRRTERGLTRNWLCLECDNKKIGDKLESPFAKNIFLQTLSEKELSPLTYDSSLLRFCISVLWRVLLVGIEEAESRNAKDGKPHLDFIAALQELAEIWRKFLLDENAQWTGENVYFLRLGIKGLLPEDIAPRMNVYSKLSIDMATIVDPFCWEQKIYAKIGPFIIFSPLVRSYYGFWEKGGIFPINEKEGVLSIDSCELPLFFKDFLAGRADLCENIHTNLSEKQKNKINELLNKNLNDYIDSDEHLLSLLDYVESEANLEEMN